MMFKYFNFTREKKFAELIAFAQGAHCIRARSSLRSRKELTTLAQGAHYVRARSSLRSLTYRTVFFGHFFKHHKHAFLMVMMPAFYEFYCTFIQFLKTDITLFSFMPSIPYFIYHILCTITRRTILMYPFKYLFVFPQCSPRTCSFIPWISITTCPLEAF